MRVLLVEDDEDLRFGVAAALRAAGFAVDEVADLPQADEALFVTPYDCAVFDRMLPSGDAAGYVAKLRRRGGAVPVLFLTARDTVADRAAASRAAATTISSSRSPCPNSSPAWAACAAGLPSSGHRSTTSPTWRSTRHDARSAARESC